METAGLDRSPMGWDLGTQVVRTRWGVMLLLVAIGLMASWLVPPCAAAWSALDQWCFRTLNGTLAGRPAWQRVVALANCRAFDLVAGTVLSILLAVHLRYAESQRRGSGWYGLAGLAVLLLAGRLLLVDGLAHGWMGYHRQSPSLAATDALRLSHLVPDVAAKDASPWCFPGDHGYVLTSVAIFLTLFSRRELATLAWLAAAAFAMPRLISGAHWLSDIAVGSLAASLVTLSWILLPLPTGRWWKQDRASTPTTGRIPHHPPCAGGCDRYR